MMSAPNHRPLLNGSKICVLWCAMIAMASCATSSVATSKGSPTLLEPNTDEVKSGEDAPLHVDTMQWTLVSDPPITSDMAPDEHLPVERKETYEVALLIPFRTSGVYRSGELDANKEKFAHFYAGMKQAIQDHSRSDLNVHITTYDTNRSKADLEKILSRMDAYRPDLIVGPYESDLIAEAARFAKENRIPLISPWKASTRITSDNVYFLQLRPNITEYYSKIVQHLNNHFDRSEVLIIGRKTGEDNPKIRAIQEINQLESSIPVVQAYREFLVDEDSLMVADSMVFDHVLNEEVKAFFLPHFSSRDEGFLYSCLRKLYAEKGDRDIAIYTMPLALNSDRIDINILKNLNLRICEYRFADMRNPQIQSFRQKYFDEFGWLPTEDSFFGNDVMNLIFYGLKEHGKYFHYYMAGERIDLNQMSVFIEPYSNDPQSDVIDYMMNSHLSIISFVNDRFTIRDIR